MRQIHKADDKLFVDYAGQTVPIVSGSTGEVRTAQIFVAVMGATNYTFAEATYSQSLPDWWGSHHTFFSLAELNTCIKALLIEVNNKSFKQFKGSRRTSFESIDRPVLSPLPKHTYQYTDIKQVNVNIDYHVQYDEHLYSVPHHLVGERIAQYAKANVIELLFHNKVVASHARQHCTGMSTVPSHMPTQHEKNHQQSNCRVDNVTEFLALLCHKTLSHLGHTNSRPWVLCLVEIWRGIPFSPPYTIEALHDAGPCCF